MNAEAHRLFVAVELPAAIRYEIAAFIKPLVKTSSDMKWVDESHFHITLKFLGSVSEERIPQVRACLAQIAKRSLPLWIRLGKFGGFPSLMKPSVLWVGLNYGEPALADLAKTVDEGFHALGFHKEERRFTGHVTVGRIKKGGRLGFLCLKLPMARFECRKEIQIGHLTLYKSLLTNQGAEYFVLERMALGGGESGS